MTMKSVGRQLTFEVPGPYRFGGGWRYSLDPLRNYGINRKQTNSHKAYFNYYVNLAEKHDPRNRVVFLFLAEIKINVNPLTYKRLTNMFCQEGLLLADP